MTKKITRFKYYLRNKTLFKRIFYKLFCSKKFVSTINPTSQNFKGKYAFNYKYDCNNPRTFNEYLGWIKYNYENDLWKKCADKIKVKDFLKENGFNDYVPKLLGIYSNVNQIDLDKLPNKFVLKTNHDCGSVFICNKQTTDFNKVFSKLSLSLKKSYFNDNGEWVYKDIVPQIFAEELLEPNEGEKLYDYKLFSFNGNFGFGFVAQDRNVDCRFTLIDENFNYIDSDYIYLRPKKTDLPKKPKDFDLMVKVANKIGKILNFARVDFYQTSKGIKIGEITFFSQSGLGAFTNSKYDFQFGNLFKETIFFDLVKNTKEKGL